MRERGLRSYRGGPPRSTKGSADGRGVLPDDERAADAGYDFAQYALGKLLESQDQMGEAVSWYGKAAAQGNSCAAYRLGKLYLTGQGVKQDWEQAWAYFYESAEQGNEYADFFPEHFD